MLRESRRDNNKDRMAPGNSSDASLGESPSDLLRNRVFYAARDGMAMILYSLLCEKSCSEVRHLLSSVIEEDGQRCSPLLVACRNGHDRVVKLLLSKFASADVGLEREGRVTFDGFIIDGASPLWCSAAAGHLGVVKTLVRGGADVNHPTKTNSTPLRAACFDGRLDVVTFLAENGADIHMANKYNNTCLMIAAHKGYLDVVEYLLKKGADPDVRALCGATAVHFAAELGHDKVVRALLEHGANLGKNEHGMTPLAIAAERTRSKVVEYLVARPQCATLERIEALELLGASFAHDKDHYSLEKCFHYLDWAMRERFPEDGDPMPKPASAPIAAYENRRECADRRELSEIRYDANALHMEALVIRERIMGPNNVEVPHPIIYRGAVFADCARFDRCLSLWMHALRLRQGNGVPVAKDLLRFAQVFSQMQHVGVDIPFDYLEEVLTRVANELAAATARAALMLALPQETGNPVATSPYFSATGSVPTPSSFGSNVSPPPSAATPADEERDDALEELDTDVHSALYLLVLTTKVLRRCGRQQELKLCQLVYRIVQTAPMTRRDQSLLHLAVNPATSVDDFHTNDVCRFPCAPTARLLVQCGADVNAVDHGGNTPLHLIVGYQNPVSDFLTLHSVIMALVEAGAHMDTVNFAGHTPFEAATSGVAEIILRTQSQLSLQCMAAKAVRKFNLAYRGHVSRALERFIELHGRPVMSCV